MKVERKSALNESINNGGVCRTAPATPGLLITCIQKEVKDKGQNTV